MTTFSTTDRGTFKTCREQWDHVSLSRQGLERPLPAAALLLGSLVHYTQADWLQDPKLNPTVRFMEHFEVARQDIYERYARKYNAPMDDDEFEDRYGEPVGELGRQMIAAYEELYQHPVPSGFTLIAAEQTATIEVPGTEHCTVPSHRWLPVNHFCAPNVRRKPCVVEHHKLEGTFDALIADARGRIFIVDHKTYAKQPSQTELALNDQFLAYTWLGRNLGFDVAGVFYNGLWKRTWDQLLDKSGKPRKSSRGDTYTREDLFFRTMIPHPPEEVDAFGARLATELNEMGNNPAIYINRNWYSCPQCSIQDLCLAKTRGEEWEYLLDEFSHREKTPAWRAGRGE